jgi:16S rRNA U516 pseudouridylate synthase RsuA-like enzyme
MLTLADLERLGKEIGVRMQTVRQPDATRGRAANYWYEVRMRDTKKEELRRLLFKEKHPLEKLKRIGLGTLTVEGIPRGRYRMIEQKEAEKLRKFEKSGEGREKSKNLTQSSQRAQRARRREEKADSSLRSE